jgi:hypothetical protein
MKALKWWAYIISGIVLLLFLAPALISAADTVAVLAGVGMLVLYGVWSWKFLIRGLIKQLKETLRD